MQVSCSELYSHARVVHVMAKMTNPPAEIACLMPGSMRAYCGSDDEKRPRDLRVWPHRGLALRGRVELNCHK